MNLETVARKWALKNRHDHGRAQASALVGKVIAEVPEAKNDVPGLKTLLEQACADVNALPDDEAQKELSQFEFQAPKSGREEKLPEVPISRVITRVAPNPSGFLHIGHAKNLVLCDEYAKKTHGQLMLRLEDTDPKTKKPMPEAYEAIPKDAAWLECRITKTVIQSERLPIYYEHAEKLIEMGHAYVCSCIPEKLQKNRAQAITCGCRSQTPAQALREFKDMHTRTKEGKAVLRIKTDMQHENASLRDWPAMRIVEGEHPRVGKKYRVWPLYNFAAAIDDHLMGINLVLRGKEHELNADKQRYIYDYFGWKAPYTLEYGMLHIEGAMAHKSDIIQGIKEGKYSGWDDVRLPTLLALRKRGIQPQAIRKYMIALGIKPRDSTLDWNILYTYNKEALQDAPHFFFVEDPVALETGLEEKTLQWPTHPGAKQTRDVPVTPTLYIAKKDADTHTAKTIRLKDLCNVDLPSGNKSADQEHAGKPKIQWVASPGVPVKVIEPDGSEHQGVAEPAVSSLKQGTTVQFERYGYARFDHEQNGVKIFYFAHP
ncbi:glutamate--tRNA ligase [Candidatus Micrarchaeota archaeon]|nr:glutamate--tRNA ligase [Candidatus Micrarchaeota archaeon]